MKTVFMHVCVLTVASQAARQYNSFKQSFSTKYFFQQLMQTFRYKYMYIIRFKIVHV